MATNDTRTKADLQIREEELLSLLDDIWNSVVDCDDESPKADLLDATDEVAEILNEFDETRFPFEDEEDPQEIDDEDEAAA